jgi:TPR repeat protein
MIKKIIYISILLVFIFNNAAISSDLSLAKDAYNKNDFEAAYNYWEPLATEGISDAQLGLGILYGKGQGLLQDYRESIKWFKLAADQGNAEAQFYIGMAYINGVTYKKNYSIAYMWLSVSALRNTRLAKDNLPKFIKMMTQDQINEGEKLKSVCVNKNFINC